MKTILLQGTLVASLSVASFALPKPLAPRLKPPAAKRPNILLVTLDTTRPDAIDCFREPGKEYATIGWKPAMGAVTPTLDALCAKGRKFTRAYTTAPITLVAHASILTGLYPPKHGVHDNGIYTLPKDVPTLPEILKKNGYQTGAAVSAIVLDRHYGLDRGFDQYDDKLGTATGGIQLEERKAPQTVDAALKIVNGFSKAKPFFFWLHLYDPHNDYQAPEPWRSKFPPYLAEVAFMDHELGRFLDTLRKSGRIGDDTLIVVTGDHGESLGEHSEQTHGIFLYESTLRVPLMVIGGHYLVGADTSSAVSLIDIFPTVLEGAASRRESIESPGFSLPKHYDHFESMHYSRSVYSESELAMNSYHWAPLYSTLTDYTLPFPNGGPNADVRGYVKTISAPRPEQYKLDDYSGQSEGEESNLFPGLSKEKRLESLAGIEQFKTASRKPVTQADDPKARAALQQLGYVSGPSQANDDLPRPDPKDVIGLLPKFDEARGRANKGDCAGAKPILEEILKQNPGNVPVLAQLGWCRIETGDPRGAVPLYAQALKLNPSWEVLHYQLGSALDKVGDKAGASREWKAALALNPRTPPAAAGLIRLAREGKDYAAAEKNYAEARAAGLEDGTVEFEAAMTAHDRGDAKGTEAGLRRTLAADPAHLEARVDLANLLYGRGEIPAVLHLYEDGLKARPEEGKFLLPLGAIQLNDRNDPAAAAALFRRFLRAHPNDPEAPKVRELLARMENGR